MQKHYLIKIQCILDSTEIKFNNLFNVFFFLEDPKSQTEIDLFLINRYFQYSCKHQLPFLPIDGAQCLYRLNILSLFLQYLSKLE